MMRRCVHEGVIDGDDKDFACAFEFCVLDVSWNMRFGA